MALKISSRKRAIALSIGPRPLRNSFILISKDLERAGLEFIPENGGGAGIRFRERKG